MFAMGCTSDVAESDSWSSKCRRRFRRLAGVERELLIGRVRGLIQDKDCALA
jgi:hypothetical protein